MTRVFVIGATGVIGRRAVARLVAAGHEVTGVARSDEKAAALRSQGAAAARVDPFDAAALTDAARGCDAIVNLATHIPSGAAAARGAAWRENDRIRREVSAHAAAAATANDCARLVQESIVLVYADGDDAWIDEDAPVAPAPTLASAVAAEQNALAAAGGGALTAIVLRFGLFYAPEAAHLADAVKTARKGLAPVVGAPDAYLPTVDADDAAAAVVAALGGVPNGAYNVVDDEPLTRGDYARVLAGALGKRRLSFAAARAAALAGDKRTGGIGRSLRVANGRFKQVSGWAPSHANARAGYAAAVAAHLAAI